MTRRAGIGAGRPAPHPAPEPLMTKAKREPLLRVASDAYAVTGIPRGDEKQAERQDPFCAA